MTNVQYPDPTTRDLVNVLIGDMRHVLGLLTDAVLGDRAAARSAMARMRPGHCFPFYLSAECEARIRFAATEGTAPEETLVLGATQADDRIIDPK